MPAHHEKTEIKIFGEVKQIAEKMAE